MILFRVHIDYGGGAIGKTVPLPLDKAEWLINRLKKRGHKVSVVAVSSPQHTRRPRKRLD